MQAIHQQNSGKAVVIDFWGTWCYWCIKGVSQMREYYQRLSQDVEFIGIDCWDNDEEKWRQVVKDSIFRAARPRTMREHP